MKELSYIFLTFLKLGATAFGGYMSLVALVQRQIVEIDKKLGEEDLLDGISFISVLPGPFAVNVCTYVGYRLKGILGAITAFTGIILPSFIMVVTLSYFYFTYDNIPTIKSLFNGVMPAIIALIITVATGMTRKNIKRRSQWLLCLVAAVLLICIGGFMVTCLLIIGSGILGLFLYKGSESDIPDTYTKGTSSVKKQIFLIGMALLLLLPAFLWYGHQPNIPVCFKVLSAFSGVSLTLFGGGYVVIPALHELFVENLGWLTSIEFADGIAIGQITPGPIFITAAFIGYKIAAIPGTVLATVGIFAPPALVTIISSYFVSTFIHSPKIKAAMKGIHPAVIGMIFASAFILAKGVAFSIPALLIFLAVLFLSFKYNISPVYLIIGAGVTGIIIL
ncbi:MAG: chromate efflux transporter [Tannerellaceae bacterium]|jgi:chromate transporter|nr:chromate efflux transporter [Tannerellaceae bacterium]